jgi:tRNA uridine 5-carboxymethylaminomethyl modification enzyme
MCVFWGTARLGGKHRCILAAELAALGAITPGAADRAAIHTRNLGRTGHSADPVLRMLLDRTTFSQAVAQALATLPHPPVVIRAAATALTHVGDVWEVQTSTGELVRGRSVVLAVGAGVDQRRRQGQAIRTHTSMRLIASLCGSTGVRLVRHASAVPPRLDGRWLPDSVQWIEPDPEPGSWTNQRSRHEQRPVAQLALPSETIPLRPPPSGWGVGPRFCPGLDRRARTDGSITVYLEPDDASGQTAWLIGAETSRSEAEQMHILQHLPGFDPRFLLEPAYGVDFVALAPGSLTASGHLLNAPGLFVAGQLAGTSGYEEAAAQGHIAGINAARYAAGLSEIVPDASTTAIGALCAAIAQPDRDDGPLRFVAQNRFLRADSAAVRTHAWAQAAGLPHTLDLSLEGALTMLRTTVTPTATVNQKLRALGLPPIHKPRRLSSLIRSGLRYEHIGQVVGDIPPLPGGAGRQITGLAFGLPN